MGLSIIIVNYNVTNEIDECLRTIQKYFTNVEYEIIVIDNSSEDRSIENLSSVFPQFRFELLNENLGYSKANNFGAGLSKFEYLLFLNPDILIIEDFISTFLIFYQSNKNVGACGPMLLYKDLKYQNSSGQKLGIIYEAAEAFMFINIYRELFKFLNRQKFRGKKPFKVAWLSGACLFISKNNFNLVNGFNSQFFLNYEDIDLCEKLNERGFLNYYFPNSKCIHLDQKSQRKNFEKLVYTRYQSRLIYAKNHYQAFKSILIRFIHITGIILRLASINFLYEKQERVERSRGYMKAFKLYTQFR